MPDSPLIRLRQLLPRVAGAKGVDCNIGQKYIERYFPPPSPLSRGEKVPKADEGS